MAKAIDAAVKRWSGPAPPEHPAYKLIGQILGRDGQVFGRALVAAR